MRIPRLFHYGKLEAHSSAQLSTSAAQHAVQVLRLTVGEKLSLFNGDGHDYHGTITAIKKNNVDVSLDSKILLDNESPLSLELGIALIKSDRLDLAIQKATELGVNAITPLTTEYSSIKIRAEKREKKYHHWQGVIHHACEQSGRARIPALNPVSHLKDWLLADSPNIQILVLNPLASTSLDEIKTTLQPGNRIRLLVGPEGGFSQKELKLFEKNNLLQMKLGPRILRAETAAVSALTLLQYALGDLD